MRRGEERAGGYLELLRGNRDFTCLWLGQVVSQTGDWFNSVALFSLLLSLTGSGEAVGYILILKMLPHFFVGPLAGVAADRFNRKTIMIVSDILRGLLALGFLFVRRPEQVWIVYTLTALQVIVSTFFEPSKSAAIPSIVKREQLIPANTLSGATWSITLALGAALGGVVTDLFGRDVAFILDGGSFFLSAVFIAAARIPSPHRSESSEKRRLTLAEATGAADLIEGWRFLKNHLPVMALLLVKSGWGIGGGVLLLLAVYGKEIFPIGRDGATSIGLFYAARGIGALLGPILARNFTGDTPRILRRAITIAFFMSTFFYLIFAQALNLVVALIAAVGAHAGGSIQWVFSTTLLQMEVPNRFLGRVFALEFALLTLTMSLSTYLTGFGLDHAGLSARWLAAILGLSFLIPAAMWYAIERWLDQRDAMIEVAAESEAAESSLPPG